MNTLLKKNEPTIIADFFYDKGKLTFVEEHCEKHGITQTLLDIILINSDIISPPIITINQQYHY